MPIVETEVWKKNPERPGTVIFDSQRPDQDVFDDLKAHLEADGRLPDEYFLFDAHSNWRNNALFPRDAEILCSTDYGGSEGVYLDIFVRYQKDVYEYNEESQGYGWHKRTVTEHFATGKTLGETIDDLDRMNLVAASVTAAFNGRQREIKERYAKIESGEIQAVYPIPQNEPNVLLGESDKSVETLFSFVQPGDWVMAAGNNDYRYLIGTVKEIDILGTPGHETDNDTDDVHVDFTAFEYPPERITEIERRFAVLTGNAASFSQLPLDDVIMAPKMLISLSHIGTDERTFMGNVCHNCEAFCNSFPGGGEANNERHAELISRVEQNYSDYLDFLVSLDNRALIDMAGKIQATSDARLCLSTDSGFSDDEVEYLLKFQNPLEIVADVWYERTSDDSDMSLIFHEIFDKQDALHSYPLINGAISDEVPLDASDGNEKTAIGSDIHSEPKNTNAKADAPKPKTLAEKLQAAKLKVKEQDEQGNKTKSRNREER
jgi:hypothetical protein